MMPRAILTRLVSRQALRVCVAVAIALVCQWRFSFSQGAWLVLSTFLMMQTTRGTALRQQLMIFITLLGTSILAAWMVASFGYADYLGLGLLFVIIGYLAYERPDQADTTQLLLLIFLLILLVATLLPFTTHTMLDRALDIIIGSLIAILCGFMFPIQIRKEFDSGLLPLLDNLRLYNHALTEQLLQREQVLSPDLSLKTFSKENYLQGKKIAVEMALYSDHSPYPEWVYETGFNPHMRGGMRFYLLNIENIIDILLAMDYLVSEHLTSPVSQNLAAVIDQTMQTNSELFAIITAYFQQQTFNNRQNNYTDYIDDIKRLEEMLNDTLPAGQTLLALSPYYLYLIAFVQYIKDIRKLLLKLLMALPAK